MMSFDDQGDTRVTTSSARLRKLEAEVARLKLFCIALLGFSIINVLVTSFAWLEAGRR
jgi:hypothetical protein